MGMSVRVVSSPICHGAYKKPEPPGQVKPPRRSETQDSGVMRDRYPPSGAPIGTPNSLQLSATQQPSGERTRA
jgi:hypothetical protein